jgi:hypothetical protein
LLLYGGNIAMSVLALADKLYDVQIAAIERGLPGSTLR